MGARRHGQGGTWPPGNVEKWFWLQMLSKTSVDEVFMHHFEKMSSASGSFAPDPHWGAAPEPCWGTSILQTPSVPNPEKNSACAYGKSIVFMS